MRRRRVVYLSILAFLVYTGIMIGPYLRSAVVRDASVTTWSRAAVAPIDGQIVSPLPEAGSVINEDGLVARIRNRLLLDAERTVEQTHETLVNAEVRIAEANEYLKELAEFETERVRFRDQQAKVFVEQLGTEIANLRVSIDVNSTHIEVLERIVERQRALVERGAGSEAGLDEALVRLVEMRAARAELNSQLNFALLRLESADDAVYITAAGTTPDWVHYGEMELKLEMRRTRHDMHAAEGELAEAEKNLEHQTRLLSELREAPVTAPPGVHVYSVLAAPGATVEAGDRLIEWIDCARLMIDVPVSDAELPLIRPGMTAEVVLEGEPHTRTAAVHLSRGSSATLGRTDLAAIAKGRTEGVAQVLLRLEAEPSEFDRCPVGRAAYVEFPDVGLIDVLRARLRL